MIMDSSHVEEAMQVLTSALFQLKWRLKHSSKLRLETDILALCSGMRPLVMIDYGGKMPQLQDQLCSLLAHISKGVCQRTVPLSQIHKDERTNPQSLCLLEILFRLNFLMTNRNWCDEESTIFQQLRVMVIEDMIYLLNAKEFSEYIIWSLSSDANQYFVDLEKDPLEMVSAALGSSGVKELESVQNFFSSVFTPDGVNRDALQGKNDDQQNAKTSRICQFSEVLDCSSCMQDYQITIPTLNGWLLGYPVVYLFGKDHISDAIYNLSTTPLHLYRVLVHRNVSSSTTSSPEELMSFSVPYDLSMKGRNESWAQAFWVELLAKHEKCKQVWRSIRMEVDECYPQAIAL